MDPRITRPAMIPSSDQPTLPDGPGAKRRSSAALRARCGVCVGCVAKPPGECERAPTDPAPPPASADITWPNGDDSNPWRENT